MVVTILLAMLLTRAVRSQLFSHVARRLLSIGAILSAEAS